MCVRSDRFVRTVGRAIAVGMLAGALLPMAGAQSQISARETVAPTAAAIDQARALRAVAPSGSWQLAPQAPLDGCTMEILFSPEPPVGGRPAPAVHIEDREFIVLGRAELRCREGRALPRGRSATTGDGSESDVFGALPADELVVAAARADAEAELAEFLQSVSISTTAEYRNLRRLLTKVNAERALVIAQRMIAGQPPQPPHVSVLEQRENGEALTHVVQFNIPTDRLKAALARPAATVTVTPRPERDRDDGRARNAGSMSIWVVPLLLVGAFLVLRAAVRRGRPTL